MSSIVAHTASASLIALTFARVEPSETPYILAALLAASVLDLDHVLSVVRDRAMYRQVGYPGNLHNARSVFHELVGLLSVGVLSALLFFVDQKLARIVFISFTVHLTQDWVLGRSSPLRPIDNTSVQFFPLTLKQKVIIDSISIIVFGVLWILYLSGGL